jgi:adenosylcobinamide-GDP ribazoletransferase
VRALLVACRYLTTLPLPRGTGGGDLGRAAAWFPAIGLLLGLLLAAGGLVAERALPPLVGAVLLVALWAVLTGGLHLDGLADAADGLGAGWTPEERLAIMRDARTGAYGATAIGLVLAAKVAALASLPADLVWRGLLVAPVLGRLGPVLLARACPPARGEGAGHAFALTVTPAALTGAAAIAAAATLMVAGPWGAMLLALIGAGTLGFGLYLRVRLGGVTGDCLGALVEGSEAGVLVALAALAHLGRL